MNDFYIESNAPIPKRFQDLVIKRGNELKKDMDEALQMEMSKPSPEKAFLTRQESYALVKDIKQP